jgi:hypothetical protein
MTEEQLTSRRAIEALRAGVPNRDAVRALGCSQPHIEEKFLEKLRDRQFGGLLIAGDFGTGKSHLLEYLYHMALERNFVSSKIVISKETPLYDPAKLYRCAIDAAMVPDKQGSALHEITQTLNDKSPEYVAFCQRVNSDSRDFDARFAATLYIYEHVRTRDLELRDRLISFWSGHKLNQSEIKRSLRQLGEAATYRFGKISEKDLSLQRFRFAAELMTVAGYAGWILFVDEVELIGRYSLLLQPPADLLLSPQGPLDWPAEPFPYQKEGILALYQRKVLLLADDMGLGKTIQGYRCAAAAYPSPRGQGSPYRDAGELGYPVAARIAAMGPGASAVGGSGSHR